MKIARQPGECSIPTQDLQGGPACRSVLRVRCVGVDPGGLLAQPADAGQGCRSLGLCNHAGFGRSVGDQGREDSASSVADDPPDHENLAVRASPPARSGGRPLAAADAEPGPMRQRSGPWPLRGGMAGGASAGSDGGGGSGMAGLLVRPGHYRHRDEIGDVPLILLPATLRLSQAGGQTRHCQCGSG